MRSVEPIRPPVVSACGSGPTGHRWRRSKVVLPRDDLEGNFESKVLAHVRMRRACRHAEALPSPSGEERSLPSPAAPGTPGTATAPRSPSDCSSRFLSGACLPPVYAERWAAQRAAEARSEARPQAWAAEVPTPEPAAPPIVEAVRSLAVSMEEGEVESVPPHTWLVLEEAFEVTPRAADRSLSAIAGGGHVQASCANALRLVAPERLGAKAAEANFRRASRGASLVALRHATLALWLFGRQASPRPGLMALQDVAPMTSEDLLSRAHRVAGIVACQAAAATQRQQQRAASALSARFGEAQALPHGDDFAPGKSWLQRGFATLADFHDFTRRRFGNPVRTWFQLDVEENMKLGQRQFERRCLEIGYRGNLTALWKYLDGDGSGTVGIMEFHNQAAQVLAGFKAIMMDSFDDSLPDMFAALDSKRRGRLTKIEFIAAMYKVGFKGPAARLFEYLDKRNVGTVSEQDVAYMQRWRPPPYVFSTPDTEGLSELRRKFLDIYRTSLRVWRRCFDRNGSMSMSWEEFVDAVGELVRRTKLPPYSEKALAAIWRALDADCSGSITLREWDEPSHRALSEFKQWADRVHGSVVKAFRALDSNSGNAKLSEGELNRAARGDDPCRADLELIFEGLDVHGTGAILESGVRFLDVWDLSWEEWLHHEMNSRGEQFVATTGPTWRQESTGRRGSCSSVRTGFASTC